MTRKTYLFPQTRRIGFLKVAVRQYADARVALRRSSARQCTDVLRIYTMRKKSWNERKSIRTRLKTGIGCWSSILAVTLPLRGPLHLSAILSFVQVDVSRFRSFDATYEGSVLWVYVKALYSYVHTHLLGFVFRTNPRGIPGSNRFFRVGSCGKSQRIVRKIRSRPCGYPRPPAPENQGFHRKNVSYPCQVPYVL